MKTFEKWLEENDPYGGFSSDYVFLSRVWNAATLAERERCLNICKDHQRDWNLGDSISPEEIADAIRNP